MTTSFGKPNGLVGSRNSTAIKLTSLAEEAGVELINHWKWSVLERVGTITLATGVRDYALPYDYNSHIADTFWRDYEGWRLYQVSPEQMQTLDSSSLAMLSSLDVYQISGWSDTQLRVNPVPDASVNGTNLAFRYYSKSWIRPKTWEVMVYPDGTKIWYNGRTYQKDGDVVIGGGEITTPPTHTTGSVSDGTNNWTYIEEIQRSVAADTDVPLIDDYLMQLDVKWRLLKSSGFEYLDEKAFAETYRDSICSNLAGAKSFNVLGYDGDNYRHDHNGVIINISS